MEEFRMTRYHDKLCRANRRKEKNSLECPEMWENHRRRVRELEAMLDEMGIKHTKLKDHYGH